MLTCSAVLPRACNFEKQISLRHWRRMLLTLKDSCFPHPRQQEEENGFTLPEILVALAILSLSLGILLKTISAGTLYQAKARAATEAGLAAQSLMAAVGRERPLRQEQVRGVTENGYPWLLRVERYGGTGADANPVVAAYTVTVSVFPISQAGPADAPLVTLSTLRLGPIAAVQ